MTARRAGPCSLVRATPPTVDPRFAGAVAAFPAGRDPELVAATGVADQEIAATRFLAPGRSRLR